MTIKEKLPHRLIFIISTGRAGSRLLVNILQKSGVHSIVSEIKDNRGLIFENKAIFKINRFIDSYRYSLDYTYDQLENHPEEIENLADWYKQFLQEETKNHDLSEDQYIVIKDPRITYLVPVYKQLFPNSKFIHIVRDARDYAISKSEESEYWGSKSFDQNFLLDLWNFRMDLVKKYREDPSFHEMKFEDLITNPDATLKEIWQFLQLKGEAAYPELDLSKIQRYKDSDLNFGNLENLPYMQKFGYIG